MNSRTINSWHTRADAYSTLLKNYQIFTDMAMGLVKFVEKSINKDIHVMDLAAGTGLVSKLLIDYLSISPSSIYLVEPAQRMCIHARENIKTPHIYQLAAEDCLSTSDLPRAYFDFILCNASMHLMSENDIYPVVSALLKPKEGYFLYTLWYHAFDETQHFSKDNELQKTVNEVLTSFNYPKYFSTARKTTSTTNRSRKYLKETAERNGLKLVSCSINNHKTPVSFDLDFTLMTPNWLIDHLKANEWRHSEDVYLMRERIVQQVREVLTEKYVDIPVVQIIVAKD